MGLQFSEDQEGALAEIRRWLEYGGKRKTMGGLAGTGKTTLIMQMCREDPECTVAAFTGKAVSVLRGKGVIRASTLHSVLYVPAGENDDGDPIFKAHGRPIRGLVIVDEASMINQRLHQDLERCADKILYVGDHGQLEPIGYDPGLMRNPEIKLERIHRQAGNSQIIHFAHHLRLGGDPTFWNHSPEVSLTQPQDFSQFDVILCGYNKTRLGFNDLVRYHRGYSNVRSPEPGGLPHVGETLICLQNNKHMGIFNGMQIVLKSVERTSENSARVGFTDADGLDRTVSIYLPQLGSLTQHWKPEGMRDAYGYFDWGYALTTHKAQGSEWDNVCVVEQSHGSWNMPRWRYTAATRAAKTLTYLKAS